VPLFAQPDIVIRMMARENARDAGNPPCYQTDERWIKAVSVEHTHPVSAEQARQFQDSCWVFRPGLRA
jgi:hypothetical protein